MAEGEELDLNTLSDAELVEQMQDLDLLLDARVGCAGALDAVAQRLVEDDRLREAVGDGVRSIPVEEQLLLAGHGGRESYADSRRSAMPCPPPMHADPMPRLMPRRFIS